MKRINNPFLNFLLIGLLCMFASTAVFADDDDDDDEYTFTPADVNQLARDEVSVRLEPLGFGLMGDSIDPYTGTLVFNQTDVSLPGNSDLEVAIRRIASTAQMTNMQEMFFGDWILDVPNVSTLRGTDNIYIGEEKWKDEYVESSFGPYWRKIGGGWGGNICSGSHVDPGDIGIAYSPGHSEDIPPAAYWDGLHLNIPGKGREQLLKRISSRRGEPLAPNQKILSEFEASDNIVEFATKDHWLVTCSDDAKRNGGVDNGEGFVVFSPDGTRYDMNRLIVMDANEYNHAPRNIAKMYATQVTDVNGNWVKYDFSDEGKLMRIYSNDGREITLTYYSDSYKIHQVTANERTWTYTYRDINREVNGKMVGSMLHKVIQPDDNYWEFFLDFLLHEPGSRFCNVSDITSYVKHPYGVKAIYELSTVRHIKTPTKVRRTSKSFTCADGEVDDGTKALLFFNKSVAVMSKTLEGPSIPTSVWTYSYSEYPADNYGKPLNWAVSKTTEVTDPVGRKTVSHFYPRTFRGGGHGHGTLTQQILGGKLKSSQTFNKLDDLVEEKEYKYIIGERFGYVRNPESESAYREFQTYKNETITRRDGDTFTREYTYNTNQNSSDYSYGQPLTVSTYSNVSTEPRVTVNTYAHRKDHWVLNLPESVTVNGREMTRNGYDDVGKQRWVEQYGHRVAAFTYQDNENYYGALETFTDAEGRVTKYLDYFRGIARSIERNDGSTDYVDVDDNGWVIGQTDYRGFTTGFNRDSMGRVTKIIPPKKQKQWFDADISYEFGDQVIQTITKGLNQQTVTYDNFLRTVQEKQTSLTDNKSIYSASAYNEAGEMVFQAFPQIALPLVDGTQLTYDGLGRRKTMTENVAPFVTSSYDYLDSHRTQVTDPLGNKTTRFNNGFGELIQISQAGIVDTKLHRNQWGQLTQLQQFGTDNGYTSDQSQYSYYDDRQRLCRHRTAEGGDSLYQYDKSGHMVAYSKGNVSGFNCAAPSGNNKVSMRLDALARVTDVDYEDPNTADIQTSYDANGNVKSLLRGGINWLYSYNELNLLKNENLYVDSREYLQSYKYDKHGYLESATLPSNREYRYNRDGLGRTKYVKLNGESFNYATVNDYHANSLISMMRYGNDQVFSQALTKRQQPLRTRSVKGSNLALDYTYTYDKRSSITGIDDRTASNIDQTFKYDALDRLTRATGPWGNGTFKYDALGNLREKNLGKSRKVTVEFDERNRAIRSTDTSVNGDREITYDNRGNVAGLGDLSFIYDNAQQPVSISGKANGTYSYDGNFKRVISVVDGKTIYNIYDASGKLTYVDKVTEGKATEYIRLNGKSIARVTDGEITYLHRDHRGSAVAGTDANGDIKWTEVYTPYGEKRIDEDENDDLGSFTGHIDDSATGLTYMQARYYDPTIGRFLSIDPVMFEHTGDTSQFNRYMYGNNNPNKYIDPFGLDSTDGHTSLSSDEPQEEIVVTGTRPNEDEQEKSPGQLYNQELHDRGNNAADVASTGMEVVTPSVGGGIFAFIARANKARKAKKAAAKAKAIREADTKAAKAVFSGKMSPSSLSQAQRDRLAARWAKGNGHELGRRFNQARTDFINGNGPNPGLDPRAFAEANGISIPGKN